MKKLLITLILLAVCFAPFALADEGTTGEAATQAEPLEEGSIRLLGYNNITAGYRIAVPEDWAFVGYDAFLDGEPPAAIQNGMDEDTLNALRRLLTPDNNVLYAFSARGESLIVNYGEADGADLESLLSHMDEFKAELASKCVGISFTDECGRYELNELAGMLLICANYQGCAIRQYHLISGSRHYIFTFSNVDKETAQISLQNFSTL